MPSSVNTQAGKKALFPTCQQTNQPAPAPPLILTFYPAPLTLRRGEGKDMCLRSVLPGSEARRVSPLPKIVQRFWGEAG
jgi:hypothetical protein